MKKPAFGGPAAIAVIGGGPAGLMAAEVASAGGAAVTVYDRMPSFGRKFLMAGRGGLNLTHSEPFDAFARRYGTSGAALLPALETFSPRALVDWAEGLGQATFVGSSGRVFPKAMKTSPLLRAWLARLAEGGVALNPGRAWLGWTDRGDLRIAGPGGEARFRPDATILALGGASWPRLGGDGGWADILSAEGVALAPFRPANAGVLVDWSEPFRTRFAGAPLKTIALTFDGQTVRGEAMITARGLEGGAVYALGPRLRDAIDLDGSATLYIDIRPDLTAEALGDRLARPRGGGSLSNHLRKAGLTPLAINLLREAAGGRAARRAGGAGATDQGRAHPPDRLGAAGAGHLHGGRRAVRRRHAVADAEGAAGGVRRRGDAGLGGAHRRLSAAGLLRHRPGGGAGRFGLAGAGGCEWTALSLAGGWRKPA